MKEQRLEILRKVANGELSPEQAHTELLGLSIVSVSLPDFLYEDDGQIKIGYHGDTVVTDEWNKWKEGKNPQLNIPVVSCWAVLLQWTTGREADAESTEVKAIFMTKQQADEYCKILKPQIKWHHYYEGYLEVEEVPFEPCS